MRSLILAVILAVSLVGCARQAPQTRADESQEVSRMSPERARSEIATSFPLEVPVPEGQVDDGGAQGADSWAYSLVVASDAAPVADWYRTSYSRLSWQVVGERPAGQDGLQLDLVKGGAESRVTITPEADRSRVDGVLGVGVPVLQVQ